MRPREKVRTRAPRCADPRLPPGGPNRPAPAPAPAPARWRAALRWLIGAALLAGLGGVPLAGQALAAPAESIGPGPSLVRVDGRRLLVRRRAPDGSLPAKGVPYVVRGVVWSPAGRETATGKDDADNASVRRAEFARWQAVDIPLMAAMQVDTVRLPIDPGVDAADGPAGRRLLDALYARGIMVVMSADNGIGDLERVRAAVSYYKDHPAILMWMVGNEWNINLYYKTAATPLEAAQRTERAAALIKTLDSNHPVATSYGDIDLPWDGRRLEDTRRVVRTICPSVDLWALNLYRGPSFVNLFEQWARLSEKPILIGEFGTDAFRSASVDYAPAGAVDEAMQADWDLGLWNEIAGQLSAVSPRGVAVGATVFAWNDEWWKVAPPKSQQTGGFPGAHPDGVANEEYFGLVDIDRRPRLVYERLRQAFARLAQDTGSATLPGPIGTNSPVGRDR